MNPNIQRDKNKLTRPCKYCGELTSNWFAACCDKPDCRTKLEAQRERRNHESVTGTGSEVPQEG